MAIECCDKYPNAVWQKKGSLAMLKTNHYLHIAKCRLLVLNCISGASPQVCPFWYLTFFCFTSLVTFVLNMFMYNLDMCVCVCMYTHTNYIITELKTRPVEYEPFFARQIHHHIMSRMTFLLFILLNPNPAPHKMPEWKNHSCQFPFFHAFPSCGGHLTCQGLYQWAVLVRSWNTGKDVCGFGWLGFL